MAAKVLLIDIETSAIKAYTWGPKWETNLIEVIEPSKILSFSAKWLGGRSITKGLPDYKGYKKGVLEDDRICEELHGLLNEADLVVAHNGRAFDIKTINARMMFNGLKPTSPYKIFDTKTEFKKRFRLASNSLDDLCGYYGLGRKLEHEGFPLWKRCEAGDPKAWAKMLKYNRHDIVLLEALYLLMRPWAENHPNIAFLSDFPEGCPACGSRKVQSRGWNKTRTRKSKRYFCECGQWFSGKSEKR